MARSPDPSERRKRFYADVDVGRTEAGYSVALDGRPMLTPAGRPLVAPTPLLAALIAAEWAAQGDIIELAGMFATRLAYAVIDQVRDARLQIVDELVAYAGSDLLCYFAERPETLVKEEAERWGPVLDWAEQALALRFVRVVGAIHRPQRAETLAAVRALGEAMDDFTLAGVAQAAGLFGSAVLALALQRDQLDGEAAFDLSRLDEAFQQRQWGVDEEAAARTSRLRAEATALGHWFEALR
jgi:chaperone required for assembly of F1-ATPase